MKTYLLNAFSKIRYLALLMFLTLLSTNVFGAEKTTKWTATSGGLGTGIGSGTINTTTTGTSTTQEWSYTRTLSSGSSYTGWTSNCIQLGKNGGVENLTLTTSNIPGTIKSVAVECSSYQAKHKVAITVGSTTYLSSTATASWTTINSKSGSGTSSGTITISFTGGSRALYIKSITVVYEEAAAPCTTSPTVGAGSNSAVTATGATVSCPTGITSLGSAGCTISSYGFVIGTSTNPTVGGSGVTKHEVGTTYTTTGTSFNKSLTGLTSGTTYYVRPYATNGNGTSYGTQTTFTTLNVPTLTLNKSSISFGDKANGGGPYTETFTVAGSHLTSNISISVGGTNSALFSVDKTSLSYGSGTVAATTVTVSYTPTSAGSHSATITVSSTGATSKTISLSGTSKYTYTWMKNGAVHTTTLVASGTKPTFPTDPTSCDDVSTTFIGWTNAEWTGKIDDVSAKTIHESNSTMSNASANQTFYAVFAKAGAGGSTTIDDELTLTTTGVSGTSYTEWENKTATSDAVYAGQCAGGNNAIQLRSSNSNSGIVTTTSGGLAKKVTVIWNSNTTAGRTIDIYGKNSAYDDATDLYNSSYYGTKIGSIVKGTSTELTISTDYAYIGIRSNSGALYLDKVTIQWSASGGVTYSKYLTNCCTSLGTVGATLSAVSGTTAKFTWSDVAGAEKYQVKVAGSSHNTWTDATSGVTVSGLTAGSSYTAYFRAIDTNGSHCSESEETSRAFTTPKLTVTPTTITGLNYPVGSGPSEAQSFTVSGVGLTGNVTITAPTNFEVSKTSATSGFGSSVTLTPSSGTISTTTIWVRLASGKTQGTYGPSNVTVSGGSATALNVSVTGVVSSACDDPTINTHPAAATYNLNATATALSVAATKNGTGPALTYQWYSNTANNNTTSSAIPSATSSTYTPPTTATGTKYYYCVVSSGACETATNTAAITVRTPSITVSKTSIAYGDQARGEGHTETFTVTGTNLASGQGLSLAITGANQDMFSIDKTSVAQTSAGTVAMTTITVTYTPSSNGAHSATITVSSTGAESKTVALSGTGKWKVTWMKGGAEYTAGTPTTLVANSSKVTTLPTAPADNALGSCANKFMGWSVTNIGNTPTGSAPTDDLFTTAANSPAITANTTFYAVYATASGGGGAFTDVLNRELTGVTNGSSSYTDWNNKTSNSDAVYAGQSAGSNDAIQLRSSNSNSGIISTTSGGQLSKVEVEWQSSTTNGRTINIYGKNTAYSAPTDLYNSSNQGTLLGTIVKGTSTELDIDGDYTYIGIRSNDGALYLTSISITYGSPATFSDYVTECCTDWPAPTLTYSVPSGWKSGSADVNATIGSGTTHGAVSFESNNTDVLTVNASTGKIHAVGAGTATVTATWAGDATYCEKSRTSATITVSGNVTVNFDNNGGSGTMTSQSIPYNTATALKANTFTAPTCKEFYGWADTKAKADAGTRDYTDGQSVTFTTGKTLYAVWKTINYTITKGTSTGAATFTLSPASTVDCGGTITVTATPDATHKGSPIVTISPANAGTVSGTSITNVTKNITVNVSFAEKATYTITWMANGEVYTTGNPTKSVTEGGTISTLPTEPTSCDNETYTNFVGWYAFEAGSASDPTTPATFTSTFGDKVSTSTGPTGNTTYYAVFSDGDPAGWTLVTSASELIDGEEYTFGSGTAGPASGYAMGTQQSNNRAAVAWDSDDLKTFTLGDLGSSRWSLYTEDGYLYAASSSNNYLRSKASNYGAAECDWTIEIGSGGVATVCSQGSYSRKYVKYNSSSGGLFSCYESGTVYLYKKGGVGTGYISSCGVNVKVTNGEQYITSANGIWTASNTITVEGQRLTSSGAANKRIVVSSSNSKFKIRAASTQDAGTASAVLPYSSPQTYITADSWTGTFEVTYTPTSANTTENTTITVKVCNQGSETALAQKTFTVYGRSLPDNFLIAVNDGTAADGHWYAIPADMIAPYGSTCTSGLGTYKPIPITVDNGANPTKATMAPARAVYQPAQRSTPRTSPQTLRFKSKTLSGSDTYYLYGGGTGGEGTTNNTHIQNAKFTDSEKQKWFLETSDLVTYNVHLATTISPNVLGYTTGAKRIGQYSATAGTTKKDIRFLPFDVSECVYIPAPEVTGVSLDDNYTIQFPKDRLATAWQISTDGGSNWVALPGKSEIACSGGVETPTTVQGVLPMITYHGETVKIKVSSPNATCGENIGEFVVPNPVITVTTPWHLYGVTGQAFDNSEISINLSGLYEGVGAGTNVTSSNTNIHAEFADAVANGDVAVRLTMTAANATAGDHTTTLTFTSTGATTKTVDVTITMQSLALFTFTSTEVSNGGYLNLNTCSNPVTFTVSPIYQGSPLTLITASGYAGDGSLAFTLFDMTANAGVVFGNWSSVTPSSSGNPMTVVPTNLTAGHVYQWKYTNENLTDKNSMGVPYAGATFTFTAIDGTKPTALVACPVETTSFTANWVDETCEGNTTLEVYSQGASSTTYFNEELATTNTESAYYSNADGKWIFSPSWNTYTNTQADVSITSGKVKIVNMKNDAAQRGYYLLSPKLSTWAATVNSTDIWKVTFTMSHQTDPTQQVYLVFDVLDNGTLTKKATPNATAKAGVIINEMAMTSATYYTDGSLSKTYSLTISGLDANDRLRFKGVYTSSPTSLSSTKYNLFISNVKVENMGTKVPVAGSPFTIVSCATKSKEITGLTAGKTYFYTVTNSGNTSSVMTVTTRPSAPEIDFSPGKAVLQADKDGSVTTRISLEGQNLTLCNLSGVLSGPNASYFSVNLSGATYNKSTGEVGGYLDITYHPTATGNHTATYTIDGVSLELEGHACPAGYGNLATTATSVTNNSAQANWSTNTTGFLMVAENQRMNTELLINPGFEQDGLGWDGVPELFTPTSGSSHNEIKTALKRSGSNGLYVAYSQGGSFLYIGEGSGLYSGVYGAKQTLPAGTYTISAYVHGVSGSSALGNFASSDYHTMYVGFAVDYPTKYYSTSRKAIGSPTGTRINGQSTWVKVEDSFTLDEPTTGYIFIVNSTTLGANFALDDVSLKCTGIVAGNAFSEYPITSQKTYNLTGLKPSTSYSYYVVNGDGCESNIISFTTTASGAAPELEATPQPLVISGPKGSTAKSTVSITAENAYSNILLSVGDACGGRISVSPTSLSSTGGLVTVSFTPLEGDAEGDKGSCTISATTLGIAATYNITVNWNVTAGVDVNTPTIEVVTITNSTMDIEHNIEKVSENSEIRIQLDRELTPEEIEENVGDEIFFSKYYEAFMHKKLWAIYNPTNEKISLKGMQVWRSAGGSAGDKSEWNRTDVVDLANYGQEKGFIGPKEEIIIYASQNTYSCEQERTDMSGWFGYPNSGPLSYSGDDALLLVRKVRTGEADYRTPPAESVEWNDNNDHSKGHVALSWRTIVDDDDTEWTMLDIIGARAKNNMPDGSAIRGWSWKNCKNSNATESGDDKGWIGYGYDLTHENLNYYDCSALNGANGYLLSTNRCLLIRLYTVKSGNNAVAVNVGDMFTLGKGGVQPEWKGAHVPTDPSSEQDRISCENFSFVGGYDYSNYYNSWTPLDEGGDYLVGPRNPDGSYTIENMNVPRYWCNKIRIELIEHETVNGVDVDNLRHYQDYKVPIVVDENAQTNTVKFFGNPNNPSYSGADENPKKGEWSTVCADCDVVVNNNSKLTHVAAGKQQFHNMQLYAGAKLDVADNLTMTLNALQLRADNNNVSYAIINNGKASITVDSIIHVKRIDDAHWYRFSLPYDCDIASIRQLNGKSMGTYDYDGVNDNLGTWVIKEYDGKERQEMDDFAGAGNSSRHWKPVAGTATLQKHKGYIIGLYETEWAGQHKQVYFPPKNPNATYGYTEGANDTKTANVYSWAVNKDAGDQMNHGWNFVGLPFISVFNPAHTGLAAAQQGVNNSTVMIKGKFDDQYADQDNVYVSVPTDDGMKYYEQNLASTQKLEPFLAYFVQVKDPTGSVDETKEIVYAKAGRELSLAPRRISTSAADDNIRINLDVLFVADSTNFDKTGILISNDYTTEYEIGYDLIKMNRANNTAKIHSIATDNTPMAYNALPVDAANYIPLSLYAPKAGDYNISISKQSDLTNVKAAYLLYNSEQVANLKFEDYTLTTQQTGNINGYALKIVLDNKIATSTYDISTEGLIVNTAYGKIELIGVADGAEVSLVDVLGHVISTQHSTDGTVVFDIWVPGVYQLIIRTDSGIKVVKTMMK